MKINKFQFINKVYSECLALGLSENLSDSVSKGYYYALEEWTINGRKADNNKSWTIKDLCDTLLIKSANNKEKAYNLCLFMSNLLGDYAKWAIWFSPKNER